VFAYSFITAKADKQMFDGISLTTETGPKLRALRVVHQASA